MLAEIDLENCSLTSNDAPTTIAYARHKVSLLLMFMIVILGSGTASAFLFMGITAARDDQEDQFTRSSLDLVNKIEHAWEDYLTRSSVDSRKMNFQRNCRFCLSTMIQFYGNFSPGRRKEWHLVGAFEKHRMVRQHFV
jgi:hypothetical protein